MKIAKWSKKKIIFTGIIAILLIFAAGKIFFKKEQPAFTIVKVERGTIVQGVSESGVMKFGQDLTLSFKNGGRIEKIYFDEGSYVEAGQILAKLDTSQFSIQIAEAKANLSAAQAQFQIGQTAVLNAETALLSAKQNLNDVNVSAQVSLNNAYEDALNSAEDAYLKIFNAYDTVKTVQELYFGINDQESLAVKNAKAFLLSVRDNIKISLDEAKADSASRNIDNLMAVSTEYLADAFSALTTVRQTSDVSVYRDTVPSASKTSLDTHRTNINTAQTAISNSQQAIASAKTTNDANINTANNQLLTVQGNLAQVKDNVNLYSAKVSQAQAQLDLLNNQTKDSVIASVAAGQITQINQKAGENVQPFEPVFSFFAGGGGQLETDIYEEDIVKVKVGDPVDIKFTAFPDIIFSGKVALVNSSEKIIDGVVYYEVAIYFGLPAEIKSNDIKNGMTADVTIKTAEKNDVLIIFGSAVENRDGKFFVKIIKDGKIAAEREIEIGLRGDNNLVEVISGLKEGEEIAIPR